jgi:hypothetical protein
VGQGPAGQYLYRSGPLSRVPKGRCSLPGVLAQMTATEAKDAYGRPFALLRHPWVNHASIVVTCAPDGAALVDEADVDNWVAHWGAWLANLGNEPGLVGAELVIESAPDSGARLRQAVPSAPRRPPSPLLCPSGLSPRPTCRSPRPCGRPCERYRPGGVLLRPDYPAAVPVSPRRRPTGHEVAVDEGLASPDEASPTTEAKRQAKARPAPARRPSGRR